jgi:hypothetical protein
MTWILLGLALAPGAQPAPPSFIVHTPAGALSPAALEKLDEDWSIRLGGPTPRILAEGEWLSLRRTGSRLPPYPTKNCLLLTDGTHMVLGPESPYRLDDERLFFHPVHGPEIAVPLAYVTYLCRRVPDDRDDPALFLAQLSKAKRSRDVLYLRGGDSLEGTLVAPARGPSLAIKTGERAIDTPVEQIAVLAMNTELQTRPRPKKTYAHLVLANGARLQFSRLKVDGARGVLTGQSLSGARLEVPLADVIALTLRGGAMVDLSDLTPTGYTHTPFMGVKWPLALDTSVSGRQLALAGDHFDKGLGIHTQSHVTYSLGGQYRWFEALAGMEGTPDRRGQARLNVLVDGMPIVDRKELSGIVPLRISVAKARELTLRVEFSDFGDVRGNVNVADARLIK